MSRARSASTGRSYGRARVLKAWGLPRSTFYERRRRPLCLRPPARRGPNTRYSDEELLAERPNQMWGIEATVAFTLDGGRVSIFAMVDHATAESLGIHVAKRGTRFEALEPVRRAVHEQFGSFRETIACGVRLRHDDGSQFMSDDFQTAPRGARLHDAGGAGRGARRLSPALQRPLAAGEAPVSIPAAGSSEAPCPGGCCMMIIKKTVQEIGCGVGRIYAALVCQ